MMYMMKKTLFILMILASAAVMAAQEVNLSLKDCIVLSEILRIHILTFSLQDFKRKRFMRNIFLVSRSERSAYLLMIISST